jgi:hypothetical protein
MKLNKVSRVSKLVSIVTSVVTSTAVLILNSGIKADAIDLYPIGLSTGQKL